MALIISGIYGFNKLAHIEFLLQHTVFFLLTIRLTIFRMELILKASGF